MSNFGTMTQRIKDEVLRDTSHDTAYVQKAIVSAIDFFKHYRFWFNEGEFSMTLTAGTNSYSAVASGALGYPRDLISIDQVSLVVDTTITQLPKVGIQEFSELRSSSTTEGRPDCWSFHGESFLLYPTPDDDYTVAARYVKELTVADPGLGTTWAPGIQATYVAPSWVIEDPDGEPLTDGCTCAWFKEGEQLIRAKAKAYVYGEVLRDSKAAGEMENLTAVHFANLKGATDRFETPDRTTPWY